MLINQSVAVPDAERVESRKDARQVTRLVKAGRVSYKIWIDLENSPHVPFFLPIIREMERQGYQVVLTARDCFQVCELADMAGLNYRKIGRHYGKNRLAKVLGLALRVSQLAYFVIRERPGIGVSHGSRSCLLLSGLLGIRSLNIIDYEFANQRVTNMVGSRHKKWVLTPAIIPSARFEECGTRKDRILHYPGIKEDVYVPFFHPDPSLKELVGITPEDIVVTIRPPATDAHYHNPESEKLLATVFEMLGLHPEVKTFLLPRTPKQEDQLRRTFAQLFDSGRVVVPKHAVNGLDLIWHSDLVISGGGTMNREAAALDIPVYSLFRGTLGAVDRHLAETGKLVLLQSEQDVRTKLALVRREKSDGTGARSTATLNAVVNHIIAILGTRG